MRQSVRKPGPQGILLSAIVLALSGTAANAASFTDALTSGKAKVDIRARYENVDQDNALDEADA